MFAAKTRVRNWMNRRAIERGKAPLPDRIGRQFSGLPVHRDRINPATGRPHRDDKRIGAVVDRSLAQHKALADAQAARAESNQRLVREALAAREPRFAQMLARVECDPRVLAAMADRQRAVRGGRSR